MKILVADDDRATRLALKRTIERWGHHPIVASNGLAAWKRLAAPDGPRVAIIDWIMPGLDGLEICRRARSDSLQHYVYIILLTARGGSSNLLAGLEAGADDYITKPAGLEELRLRLNTAHRIVGMAPGGKVSALHLTQLRRLTGELLRSQDEERAGIARELHERIAQTVSAIAMTLASLCDGRLERSEWLTTAAGLITTAQDCVRDIQGLSYRLHPPLLDEIGLVTALRAFAERTNRSPGFKAQIEAPSGFGRLDRDLELGLFRIVQESMSQLHRECQCSQAIVRLKRGARGLRLEIVGRGSSKSASASTCMLSAVAVRERAEQYGGALGFRPTPDGAVITVVLPATRKNTIV